MKFKLGETYIFVSYPAVAFCALSALSAPDSKVFLCLLAAFLHECGHLLAMKKCGVSVESISVNLGDIAINAANTTCTFKTDVFITLAGVLANLLFALLSGTIWLISSNVFFRDFAVASLCIGFFNILPLSSLDGGNVLCLLLERRFTLKTSENIVSVVTAIFLVPLLIIGFLILFVAENNFSMLFAALYLIYIFVSKEIR